MGIHYEFTPSLIKRMGAAKEGDVFTIPEFNSVTKVKAKLAHGSCVGCVFEPLNDCAKDEFGRLACLSMKFVPVDSKEQGSIPNMGEAINFVQTNGDVPDILGITRLAEELKRAGDMLIEAENAFNEAKNRKESAELYWRGVFKAMQEASKEKPTSNGVPLTCKITYTTEADALIPAKTADESEPNPIENIKAQTDSGKVKFSPRDRAGNSVGRVLEVLVDAGRCLESKEVIAALPDIPRGTVTGRLTDSVKEGLIERANYGLYRITNKGRAEYAKIFEENTPNPPKHYDDHIIAPITVKDRVRQLVDQVAVNGVTVNAREVADVIGKSTDNVSAILSALVSDGEIRRVSYGKYASLVG